ncbi:MAG TPA: hypothetical protein VMD09_10880 [Solirubrobacteraceae bacterium]|nr:hypothetical protein [Solirubrobacteraceae bacterium]
MRRATWFGIPSVVTIAALGLAACGGSAKTTKTTPPKPSPSAGSAPAVPASSSSVTTGPVRASLRAPDHTPVVNKNWPFSVTVTDPSGHPLSGTLTVQFVFDGQVVGRDIPPTHPLKNGHWHELLKFPARATGIPLTFEVVVRTSAGSVTLNWPVKAKS